MNVEAVALSCYVKTSMVELIVSEENVHGGVDL